MAPIRKPPRPLRRTALSAARQTPERLKSGIDKDRGARRGQRRSGARHHHQTSFKPNCKFRGVSALVIFPKVAVPSVAAAWPKRGVLVNAKASNRNWSRMRSCSRNSLWAEKSQLKKPRWRSTLRPSVPNVYGGVATKLVVLKSWPRLRAYPE